MWRHISVKCPILRFIDNTYQIDFDTSELLLGIIVLFNIYYKGLQSRGHLREVEGAEKGGNRPTILYFIFRARIKQKYFEGYFSTAR